MKMIYMALPHDTRHTRNMGVVDAIVARIVLELGFALAYLGVLGWAGHGWLLVLLDRLLGWLAPLRRSQ